MNGGRLVNEKLKNSTKSKFQNYTILVVDDNTTNLKLVADCLAKYGFTTLMARNGESALKRARYVQPDIILLDVMMPDIDGFEACRRLKADEVTREIPVIFILPEERINSLTASKTISYFLLSSFKSEGLFFIRHSK